MAVTPQQIRAFVEQKEQRRRAEMLRLHALASSDAARIIHMIVQRYRPLRIVQWGSLLHEERFREYSDIDLAVEGIAEPKRFFALLHDAEEQTHFPLDIVQLEHLEPEYRELILQQGQIKYERSEHDQGSAQ